MKIELEIKDSKVDFFLELIKSFSFAKVNKLESETFKEELKEAGKYIKNIQSGKVKSRPVQDLLDEL